MSTHPTAAVPQLRDTGIPYNVVLSEFVAGRTRSDILAVHSELRTEDIDEALRIAKVETLAGRLPEIKADGGPMPMAELASLRAPDTMSERMWELIHRQKSGGLTPAELTELNDSFRVEHVMTLAKAWAKGRLRTGG